MSRFSYFRGAGLAVLGACPWLLRRMASDFHTDGSLRRVTVVWMYGTYLAHAAVYARALRRRSVPLPLARRPVRGAAATAALAGAALTAAGMGRFSGAGQVSGLQQGSFITSGPYRFTRNPQYLGYVMTLTGLAIARRSATALALAAGAAAAFGYWAPVEERRLEATLGRPYQQYLDSTPRWI